MCNFCLRGLGTEGSSAFTMSFRRLLLGSAGDFVMRTSEVPGEVGVLVLDASK